MSDFESNALSMMPEAARKCTYAGYYYVKCSGGILNCRELKKCIIIY